jgi:NADPH:quinone reductase-like Zn-dependent oxidoreductase
MATNSMRALVCAGYREPAKLQVKAIPRPVLRSGEILIRMTAASVQSADWRIQSLSLPRGMGVLGRVALGIFKPRQPVLGTELSGIVEAVAPELTSFRPGDAVIASLGARMGAHAEIVAVRANSAVIEKPDRLSFAEAACACFGGLTALHMLKYQGALKRGENILIIGASGAVGHAFVQIAKDIGAEVTATCRPEHRTFVTQMGASKTIDRALFEPARLDDRFDVVVDAYGGLAMEDGLRLARHNGRLLLLAPSLLELIWSPVHNLLSARKLITWMPPQTRELLDELGAMLEAGTFRPVVDAAYPMEQAEAAFHHVARRSKKGSIVITS